MKVPSQSWLQSLVTPPYKVLKITRLISLAKSETKWVIAYRWIDEEGRRCTRYICEVYEEADANMIVDLLNNNPI
jgi:hypothetical protein